MSSRTARVLAEFTVPSEAGNERTALAKVAEAVGGLLPAGPRLEALKTAVAEATMNAIEHGNGNRAELPVLIRVALHDKPPDAVTVAITDQGGQDAELAQSSPVPDLDAKLAGLQSPRGWGLFLIKNMVDDMSVHTDGLEHTVVLTMRLGDASTQQTTTAQQTTTKEQARAEHL